MGCIYMGTSPSGKAYIGQARSDARHKGDGHVRFRQHAWANEQTAINDAIQYHGLHAFKVTILVEAPDDELNALEVKLIDAYGTFGKWGYNQTRGGDWNPMHDESVRAKCVATHARPEIKAKHKASMKKAMGDADVRKRISDTLKRKLATPEARAQRTSQLAAVNQTKRKTNAAAAAKRKAAIKKTLNDPEVMLGAAAELAPAPPSKVTLTRVSQTHVYDFLGTDTTVTFPTPPGSTGCTATIVFSFE